VEYYRTHRMFFTQKKPSRVDKYCHHVRPQPPSPQIPNPSGSHRNEPGASRTTSDSAVCSSTSLKGSLPWMSGSRSWQAPWGACPSASPGWDASLRPRYDRFLTTCMYPNLHSVLYTAAPLNIQNLNHRRDPIPHRACRGGPPARATHNQLTEFPPLSSHDPGNCPSPRQLTPR
jgi:hypothetical protein